MVNSQYMSAVIIHVLINSTRFSIITHIRVSLFFFPPEYLCSLIDSKFYKEKIFFSILFIVWPQDLSTMQRIWKELNKYF